MVKFGLQLWPQRTDWNSVAAAAVRADRAGWDSLWTWDHLLAVEGPADQPIFEGWTLLAACAALTERVTVGLCVGANTIRTPGLTAKLATTLDHISNGRAVLGLGGGWFEQEHSAFGIEFGTTTGERLNRLHEAAMVLRGLLDGESVSCDGRFYRMEGAECTPRPVQAHLPILIGGAGPRKTLRTVAEFADAWNTYGSLEAVGSSRTLLAEHCRAVGRDPRQIECLVSVLLAVTDGPRKPSNVYSTQLRRNGMDPRRVEAAIIGTPRAIAQRLAMYHQLGFTHFIVRAPAPYDLETIDRIGEVRAALDDELAARSPSS